MKYLILTILVNLLLVLGNSLQSLAQTTFSADEVSVNSNENEELSFVFLTKGSQETKQNSTVSELNDNLSRNFSAFENADTIRTISSTMIVSPSSENYLDSCNSEDYYVTIRGGILGNGWDISSVTLNGVEVSQILIQSSKEVVVKPATGTPGTGDIVITSASLGKKTIKNGFTYTVNAPKEQAKNIQFSDVTSATANSLRTLNLLPYSVICQGKNSSIPISLVLSGNEIKTK